MTNYEKVKQFIDKNPQLYLSQEELPASDEMVRKIEQELEITLQGEYL